MAEGKLAKDEALPPARAAFALVVGPGEAEMALDTLEAIQIFYPAADVWVRDDATADGTYERLQQYAQIQDRILLSRNPRSRGFLGLVNSIFALYASMARAEHPYHLVIKLDPDACLLGPGLERHCAALFAACGPGMAGAFRYGPGGAPRARQFEPRGLRDFLDLTEPGARRFVFCDLLPIGPAKDGRLRVGQPFYVRYLRRARRHGWFPGEHVLGGVYALHGETLRALDAAGFWRAITDDYRAMLTEEDHLVSLGARAMGHALLDINTDPAHPVAWLQHRPPLPKTAEELLNQGVLAVHPLKGEEGRQLRIIFQTARRHEGAPGAHLP